MALTVVMSAAAASPNVSTGPSPKKRTLTTSLNHVSLSKERWCSCIHWTFQPTVKSVKKWALTVTTECSVLIHLFWFIRHPFKLPRVSKRISETYDVATYDVDDKENDVDVTVDLSPSQSNMMKKPVVDLDVTAHGLGMKNSAVWSF